MTRPRVTVLILTQNEEANLPAALASSRWADQIVVVDSFSTDRTVEIARLATPHVHQHAFTDYARQRNWALTSTDIDGDWVFMLDADERFTPELAEEVRRITADPRASDGYYVKYRLIFMGRWIRHCGWYPSWILRLFRRGRAVCDDRPAGEKLIVEGPVGYLEHDFIHDDQRGLERFIERHNRYSSLEARARLNGNRGPPVAVTWANLRDPVARKRILRDRVWKHVPLKPIALFTYMYVWKLGFLDGLPGLWFCVHQAVQELHVNLKMRELRGRGA